MALLQGIKFGAKAAKVAKQVIARDEIVREAIRQGANSVTEVKSFLLRNNAPAELTDTVPKLFGRVVAEVEQTTGKIARLNPSVAQRLTKAATELQTLPEGRAKAIKTAQMLDIITEQIPVSIGAKLSMGQTLAQLLNPKTAARNIIGNLGFAQAEAATDIAKVPIDILVSSVTGARTATGPRLAAGVKGFVTGAAEGLEEALQHVNLTPVTTRFDLPRQRIFRGRAGTFAEQALNIELRVPDRAAYRAAKDATIEGLTKARNAFRLRKTQSPNVLIPDTPEAIEEVAHTVGLYRTFQDENVLSRTFRQAKQTMNIIGISKRKGTIFSAGEFGLGDVLLKYPFTPANLIARGLAYSPASFLRSVQLLAGPAIGRAFGKKLLFDQRAFVDATARGLTGSAIVATGAHLEQLDIITGERPKDRDIAALQKATGFGEYRVNVSSLKRYLLSGLDARVAERQEGDWIASYDWFLPLSIPFAMGANISESSGAKGHTVSLAEWLSVGKTALDVPVSAVGTAFNAVAAGLETMAEQPLIANMTRSFRYESLKDTFGYIASQVPASFTPTLFSQVRQLVDNQARETYDPSPVMVAINRVLNKLPGASQMLPPRHTTFGEPAEFSRQRVTIPEAVEHGRYGALLLTVMDTFFSPAFVDRLNRTPEGQMVLDLYASTGEARQAPRLIAKKQRIKGLSIELDGETMSRMQRYVGTRTRDVFRLLSNSRRFQAKPDDEKISEMVGWMTAIGKAARVEFLGQPLKGSELRSKRTGKRTKTGQVLFSLPLTDEELE